MDEGVVNIEGEGKEGGGEKEKANVEDAGHNLAEAEGAHPFVEPTESTCKPKGEKDCEGDDGRDDAKFSSVALIGLRFGVFFLVPDIGKLRGKLGFEVFESQEGGYEIEFPEKEESDDDEKGER